MSSTSIGASVLVGGMILCITLVILAFLEINFGIIDRFFKKVVNTVNPPKRISPKVAYKKGFLLPGGGHFRGVMGGYYLAEDSKNPGSLGFHAYNNFSKALAHDQEGNVLLEVVLSGEMSQMEQGYVAERQRVLQIIPYQCADVNCLLLPTHFAHRENDEIEFFCPIHVVPIKGLHKAARLVDAMPFVQTPGPFVVETIDKLPWRFPWMMEHKIVIGNLKGRKKFVPTVIEESDLS